MIPHLSFLPVLSKTQRTFHVVWRRVHTNLLRMVLQLVATVNLVPVHNAGLSTDELSDVLKTV